MLEYGKKQLNTVGQDVPNVPSNVPSNVSSNVPSNVPSDVDNDAINLAAARVDCHELKIQ